MTYAASTRPLYCPVLRSASLVFNTYKPIRALIRTLHLHVAAFSWNVRNKELVSKIATMNNTSNCLFFLLFFWMKRQTLGYLTDFHYLFLQLFQEVSFLDRAGLSTSNGYILVCEATPAIEPAISLSLTPSCFSSAPNSFFAWRTNNPSVNYILYQMTEHEQF